MLRRNEIFRDRPLLFDSDSWWWINFQESQIQMRRHCDHNLLHWEGYCNQQSDWFLKSTPLLQVSLVTWRSSPVVVGLVSKMCVASLSGWFRTALFRALRLSLRLIFCGKHFATPQTSIFTVITPYILLFWLLAASTLRVQMPLLLTKLLLHSHWTWPLTSSVSGFPYLSKKWKLRRKKSESTKISI